MFFGRYTFDRNSPGTPHIEQEGEKYAEITTIQTYYQEIAMQEEREKGGRAAESLENFVKSVKNNHGYYIARYEASFGSGTSFENYKLQVKKSLNYNSASNSFGALWQNIKQEDASVVSRNMYNGEDIEAGYVKSDLVNSYAWDTAIVYIQAMKNNNYANATRGGNKTLNNTGETGDKVCNIYDMAGNLSEWTTEYGTRKPCVGRGGTCYGDNYYTSIRNGNNTDFIDWSLGFRPLLYLINSES